MLKPQVHHQTQSTKSLFSLDKPFLHGNGGQAFLLQVQSRPSSNKPTNVRVGFSPSNIKAITTPFSTRKSLSVKGVVTVKRTIGSIISDVTLDTDDLKDLLGRSLLLEIVSAELDPKTGLEKETVKDYAYRSILERNNGDLTFKADFKVPLDFGEVGAIYVVNEHQKEFFLKDVVLDGFPNGPINIACDSWIQPKSSKEKRVFFTNKSYLPSETPIGLERLRGEELDKLRGNGQGQRKTGERIYDYDVYNDFGDPDKSPDLARPVLGGKEHPYPRRCRTGRRRCKTDPSSERRDDLIFYVPRDESFSGIKTVAFGAKAIYSAVHSLIPILESALLDTEADAGFPYFSAIDTLFNEGVNLPNQSKKGLTTIIPRLVKGGVIESTFSSSKFSTEYSSFAYDKQWRFDHEGLPKDLISRGLAVEDPSAPHGLKLTIEDHPFANDGLVLWDSIKQWVTDYVNHYYPNPNLVESDTELQAWWSEIRNVGHGDKKDEPWWPVLKTQEDLIEIITTIAWVSSGHHAAVNFGQYTYGGYIPNRPTIARAIMPDEDPTEEKWKFFLEKPEATLLASFPSKMQTTKVMTVLDVLSSHSPDEEYLGDEVEPSWKEDPVINAAFERFNGRLKELEGIVDARNANPDLKNRNGAGMMPYELLKPFSEAGVTGKGVPNSISI